MPLPPRKYKRCKTSHPIPCLRKVDVASQEVEKVQDITFFILLAGRCRGLPGSTEGSRYHILYSACGKLTWHPRKYRRFEISHPFCCLREDAVASHKVQKVRDITSFLLLAGRCRGLPQSREGARHHFCLRKVDVASQEVEKVHDITSFLMLA
jgi:hypothetical protein